MGTSDKRRLGRLGLVSLGFLALYLVLVGSATATNSNFGERGGLVLVSVLLSALVVEQFVSKLPRNRAAESLGFRQAAPEGWRAGLMVSALLVLTLVALIARYALSNPLRAGWPILLIGLFCQGGVAEETVFRGYLFRHFRDGRAFWPAAWLSMVPFTLAHGYMFWTMPPVVAGMAVLVAVSTSFPFARLYELSGGSVWPCAVLHFATHLIKLIVWPEDSALPVQLIWMVSALAIPWTVFLIAKRERNPGPSC